MITHEPDREFPGRALLRDLLVFAAFAALTVVMTWPWAAHVRDAASDGGDPYLNSWIMYWDFHQTFHDPGHLFDGNIFFPYRYSLAFSEHNYGIAVLFFPLYALGLRPVTAQSLATLLGFAFCGFGAFRLTRTLTGSSGAGWIAGIAFAFVPYRFLHVSHLNYLFAGWMPILLEALVLHLRAPTKKRAFWLGAAFFMNALTCIHWFVLTLLPLAATFVVLLYRSGAEKRRAATRAAFAVGAALVLQVPFLLPYRRAAKLYGFERHEAEARDYSATAMSWLTADPRNHLWRGLGLRPVPGEQGLFPGLALLLLPLAAVLLVRAGPPRRDENEPTRHAGLPWLDAATVAAGLVALFAATPEGVHVAVRGTTLLLARDPSRALVVLTVLLLARWWIAYPRAFTFLRERSLRDSISRGSRPDAIVVAGIWAVLGFLGSFGMNGVFHRTLFRTVFLFRSIRAPVRWAMVCDLGLAILAGLGAVLVARAAAERFPRGRRAGAGVLAAIALAILWEDRVVPWEIVTGDADPDPVTLRLKETPMKGGIVELPAGVGRGNYRYVLRAADHLKPLITAVSGFTTPFAQEIQDLTHRRPVPDDLMPLLEKIPTSYVVVHDAWLEPDERATLFDFLAKQMAAGRLRFVRRFGKPTRDDLYAVVRTEPDAKTEQQLPWTPAGGPLPTGPAGREDANLIGSVDDPPQAAAVRGELLVRGWARTAGENLDVTILLDGELRAPRTAARTPRPDVASVLPSLGDCSAAGYEARYAFEPDDEGTHELSVLFRTKDGRVRHYPIRRFRWTR